MRRFRTLLTALILLFLLCACGSSTEGISSSTYTVTRGSQEFLIDSQNDTITCDGITYTYQVTGLSNPDITITYPDGSTY